jgi:hypothetical protein
MSKDVFGGRTDLAQQQTNKLAASTSTLGRPIECLDPLARWDDFVNPSGLTDPPVVRHAAVRTVRLGHRVRKPFKGLFVDADSGGKFSTGGRTIQH